MQQKKKKKQVAAKLQTSSPACPAAIKACIHSPL
jgi:hypothetical protein